MVKIRLMRMGMKGAPSYRVVVADARSPRDGRIIENIGWYNPRTEPSTINIDADRAKHWLGVGAQPSESVVSLLDRSGRHATPSARRHGQARCDESRRREKAAQPAKASRRQLRLRRGERRCAACQATQEVMSPCRG